MRKTKGFVAVMVGGMAVSSGVAIVCLVLLITNPEFKLLIIESGIVIQAIISMTMAIAGLSYERKSNNGI